MEMTQNKTKSEPGVTNRRSASTKSGVPSTSRTANSSRETISKQPSLPVNKKSTDSDRFSRTAAALKEAGLMDVTMEMATLMKEHQGLQKDIDSLQEETIQFSSFLQGELERKLEKDDKQ